MPATKKLPPTPQHAHEIDDPARHTMAVGRVLIVMVTALLVGALLNAPGLRKTAFGQPLGWQRDVAVFIADRLNDVSTTLLLSEPRAGIQVLAGRSGDDNVDLSLPSPTRPADPDIVWPPPKIAFSPTKPMRLAVAGDSLSVTPGESLINLAPGTGVILPTGEVDGRISTGLARPEIFNWPAHLNEKLAGGGVDALVLTLGSNDDQALTGEGGVGPLLSPEWETEYRRRVGGLMDLVTNKGTKLFWIGVPFMSNNERYDTRYQFMNAIVRSEAEKRPGKVVYVDTNPVLSIFGGGYSQYLPGPDNTFVQVRTGDGIHFTRAGGDLVANAVLKAMGETFDLESWKNPPTTKAGSPVTTTTTSTTSPKPTRKSAGKTPGKTGKSGKNK